MNAPSKQELLQNEIEERMHELVCHYLDHEDIEPKDVLVYMRAAYVAGYTDCYKEPAAIRGKWFQKLGFKI